MDPSLSPIPGVHSAPAANPTPSSARSHSTHPSYAEMITAAIAGLKDKNGSSYRAIANYIEANYTDLPQTHSSLLSLQLKRLKSNGAISMVKHSYKLTGSDAGNSTPASKRRRGRPPKTKPIVPIFEPPPLVDPNPTFISLGLADEPEPAVEPVFPAPEPAVDPVFPAPEPVVQKRRPGRPPKVHDNGPIGLAPQDGPHSVSNGPASGSYTPKSGLKRSRGRPRKEVAPVPVSAPENPEDTVVSPDPLIDHGAVVESTLVVAGEVSERRSRGRPRGSGVSKRKHRLSTGRPVGRPRKSPKRAEKQMDFQEAAVNVLRLNLQEVQSRINRAVGALKPFVTSNSVTSNSAITAAMAVSDLEQLGQMDMNVLLTGLLQKQPEGQVL